MNREHDHDRLAELLPWYANGTLETSERRAVASHLEQCESCRVELAFLGDVRAVLRLSAARDEDAPVARRADVHSLPPELQQRLAAHRPAPSRSRLYVLPAIAASFVIALGLGVALGISWLDAPRYQTATQGATNADRTVRVAVTFTPGASLQQLNAVLREHHAVIVRTADTEDTWLLEIPVQDGDELRNLIPIVASHEGVASVEALAADPATE